MFCIVTVMSAPLDINLRDCLPSPRSYFNEYLYNFSTSHSHNQFTFVRTRHICTACSIELNRLGCQIARAHFD